MIDDKDGAPMRPNIHAENLLRAGKRYGDACLAQDKALHAWDWGKPRDDMDATSQETKDAGDALHRAARAYATRMRRKAPPRKKDRA